MGEEEPNKVEADASEENALVTVEAAAEEEKTSDSKALTVTETQVVDPPSEKNFGGSIDRDVALAQVSIEKKSSFIKAWEESEKSKAENKAQKKMASIVAWENSKKAVLEAKLRKIEEALEKKKAERAEKMKNKVAMVHKAAEEKRAMVEAKRSEDLLMAEESAAKSRATGIVPKKAMGCFGS